MDGGGWRKKVGVRICDVERAEPASGLRRSGPTSIIFVMISVNATATVSLLPVMTMTRSFVCGKNSVLCDTLMRAPVEMFKPLITEPPFPMMFPTHSRGHSIFKTY